MKCKQISQLIHDYVDGRIPQCDCDELEAHLSSCPDCAAEVEEVRSVVNSLGSLCGCSAPVDCWESIKFRLPANAHTAPLWKRLVFRPVLAAPALAVALLLAVFVMWPGAVEQPNKVVAQSTEYARYLKAHTRAQTHQVLSDPDVALAAGEMESARLTECSLK